jgi:hypothetical protein
MIPLNINITNKCNKGTVFCNIVTFHKFLAAAEMKRDIRPCLLFFVIAAAISVADSDSVYQLVSFWR